MAIAKENAKIRRHVPHREKAKMRRRKRKTEHAGQSHPRPFLVHQLANGRHDTATQSGWKQSLNHHGIVVVVGRPTIMKNSTTTASINGRGCPIPSSSCSPKRLEGGMSSALVWRRSTFSPPHCASVVTLESARGGDRSRSPCWDRPIN
jgi:hypothetical protein